MNVGTPLLHGLQRDGVALTEEIAQNRTHIQHVLQHHTVGDQVIEFDDLLHIDGIIVQDLPPIAKIQLAGKGMIPPDLVRRGRDLLPQRLVGCVAQEEACPNDAAQFTKRLVERVLATLVVELAQDRRGEHASRPNPRPLPATGPASAAQ